MSHMKLFTRDVTQAYERSPKPLERPEYCEEPNEMGLPDGEELRVVRPLYEISKSRLQWYLKYLEYHTKSLGIDRAAFDLCVMIKTKKP